MADILESLIQEAGELKENIDKAQNRLEMIKNNIKNISSQTMQQQNMESKNFRCIIAKSLNIEYDYDKMKKVLDKNVFKKVISKKYELNDVEGFLKILKEYGVPLEEVKKHIISTAYVDKEKVQDAFDEELFTLSDISGCYKADMKRVVRITRKK